jgi:hypothetical protein
MALLIYIHTNSAHGLPFLHILTNTFIFLLFGKYTHIIQARFWQQVTACGDGWVCLGFLLAFAMAEALLFCGVWLEKGSYHLIIPCLTK